LPQLLWLLSNRLLPYLLTRLLCLLCLPCLLRLLCLLCLVCLVCLVFLLHLVLCLLLSVPSHQREHNFRTHQRFHCLLFDNLGSGFSSNLLLGFWWK
jgi:hypothetical protein